MELSEQTVKRIDTFIEKNEFMHGTHGGYEVIPSWAVREFLTSEATRSQLLLEALENLIQVKNWKDKYGKDEHYEKAQPLAWENARNAIASYNNNNHDNA